MRDHTRLTGYEQEKRGLRTRLADEVRGRFRSHDCRMTRAGLSERINIWAGAPIEKNLRWGDKNGEEANVPT